MTLYAREFMSIAEGVHKLTQVSPTLYTTDRQYRCTTLKQVDTPICFNDRDIFLQYLCADSSNGPYESSVEIDVALNDVEAVFKARP